MYPRLYAVRDIADALSHNAGVSSICNDSMLAFIISGITGTISKLIDKPVNMRPIHINSIFL
jgi:hypothetical protein